MKNFEFTVDWFEINARKTWDSLIPQIHPQKILEIGSYEGASTCYLINKLSEQSDSEIFCIDTWEGAAEQQKRSVDMTKVEERFDNNVKRALSTCKNTVEFHKLKGKSEYYLSKLIIEKKIGYFDFIYVDGSHQASDVLFDALMAFKLLRVNGVIAFDDYLWLERSLPEVKNPLKCPKPAIDAFTNIYFNKVNILQAPLNQIYVTKISN